MSLFAACLICDTPAAISLIERGANVGEKDQLGETPLHFACRNGRTATAVALIERGANVDEIDRQGRTPLRWACL